MIHDELCHDVDPEILISGLSVDQGVLMVKQEVLAIEVLLLSEA